MNINSKMIILFSVLALGLLLMLGQAATDFSVTTKPTSKPIMAKVNIPEATPQPTIATQPTLVVVKPTSISTTSSTNCIEKQDREVWGGPLNYGYTQAQADGLVYSYGVGGAGTQADPFLAIVYTNCLHIALENQQ